MISGGDRSSDHQDFDEALSSADILRSMCHLMGARPCAISVVISIRCISLI